MKTSLLLACVATAAIALPAFAQDGPSPQYKARDGQMWIMALNLGILGDMAQGKAEYDAGKAQMAADTLVAVSRIDQSPLWPEGSDNMSVDYTRALPAIWDNRADFDADWQKFGEASLAMQAAAGQGVEAIGGAMQGMGGACKACHDDYRAPKD
jgi:cytochrome c556